jgi:uncharacterized protein with HEPN domain
MRPESRRWVEDMLEAAKLIAVFVTGKSETDFAGDKLLRGGIYYQFMIIGEALSRLRADEPAIAERVSEYWRIIGFRNQIIHGYARIDDEITWRIIQDKLPILRSELDVLLKE